MHTAVTVIAQYLIYPAIVTAVLAWLTLPTASRMTLAVQAAVAGAVTLALVEAANRLYYDPRPYVTAHVRPYFPHVADNGFPSDHVTAVALLGFLLWPYRRVVSVVLFAAAVLIGVARVIARVHSPVDIVAGICIAGIGAVAGLAADRLIRRHHHHA